MTAAKDDCAAAEDTGERSDAEPSLQAGFNPPFTVTLWSSGSTLGPRVYCGGVVRLPIVRDTAQCQVAVNEILAIAQRPMANADGWVPDPNGKLEVVEVRDPNAPEIIILWRFPHMPQALLGPGPTDPLH